jgi:predicted GNAT superfamily acetyltransferase
MSTEPLHNCIPLIWQTKDWASKPPQGLQKLAGGAYSMEADPREDVARDQIAALIASGYKVVDMRRPKLLLQ